MHKFWQEGYICIQKDNAYWHIWSSIQEGQGFKNIGRYLMIVHNIIKNKNATRAIKDPSISDR